MLVCFKCASNFESFQLLSKHLRKQHCLYENLTNFELICTKCKLKFYTYCGYKRHTLNCVVSSDNLTEVFDTVTQVNDNVQVPLVLPAGVEQLQDDIHTAKCETNSNVTEIFDNTASNFDFKEYLLAYTTKLHSLGIPETTIQIIFQSTQFLIENVVDNIIGETNAYSNSNNSLQLLDNLQNRSAAIKKDIELLNTSYKRNKLIHKSLVLPKQVTIGIRRDQVFDKSSQQYIEKNVTSTFSYVPILSTLTSLLTCEQYFNLFEQHSTNLTSNDVYINDIKDGVYIKNHNFFKNPCNLRIILYYDDFETTNPLGSKTGAHKIGAFYFSITNIPSYLNSQLSHIHLLALCYSSDIKQFGINAILEPIVNDIKVLETQVDPMHDILEGIAPYEIKIFLKLLVDKKLATIRDINSRLQAFPFGKTDRNNKPSPIILDKPGHLIGQRAAQTWCLIRFIPIILEDLLDDDLKAKFYLISSIISITQIALSPRITKLELEKLERLIENHLKFFDNNFDERRLPKHHMLLHYCRIMKSLGPLVNLWTMRFEAKHGYFKNLVPKLKNFTAICNTLSHKHQINMSHQWNNKIMEPHMEYGPMINILVQSTIYKSLFPNQKNIGVLKGMKAALPEFSLIVDLILSDGTPYLVAKPWKTRQYDEVKCVYIIENLESECFLLKIENLTYKEPFEKYLLRSKLTTWCIVPKYKFC
ncbi:hypothetical protein PPYR_01337 [Photinus pyralis]|uniref:C2H2-type domain-containing protein n=1 Tax=Photinus pyralis TaxID=7054 RepID=A0A5N4B423_PHOPY|nr:hypothetical protein PPYR_01337 [Photinus pyralis]